MNAQAQPIDPNNPPVVWLTLDQLRATVSKCIDERLRAHEAEKEKQQAQEPERPDLMTRAAAADLLGVSLGTIDNYIRDGLLTKKRVGTRAVRLERVEVEKLARTV